MSAPGTSPQPPLRLYRDRVRREWIDYNGHLSEPYYVLVFGHASDALYEHAGMGAAERARTRTSLYTVEAHIRYLGEVAEGAELEVGTWVLGVDAKRLRVLHAMYVDGAAEPASCEELLMLHVDTEGGRTVGFPEPLRKRLEELRSAHGRLPESIEAGRTIRAP